MIVVCLDYGQMSEDVYTLFVLRPLCSELTFVNGLEMLDNIGS